MWRKGAAPDAAASGDWGRRFVAAASRLSSLNVQRPTFSEMTESNKFSSGYQVALPELPQESNFYSHQAVAWLEAAEAALTKAGLLNPANGAMPAAAERIIDTPISNIPTEGALTRKDHQHQLALETENMRNAQKRELLTLQAWTAVYSGLLECAMKTCPLLHDAVKKTCPLASRNPAWAEFYDGPRAYKMVLYHLFGRPRTKADKLLYKAALDLQLAKRLPDGATSDEFSKRARAFDRKINPHLLQPYVDKDYIDYIFDLLPKALEAKGSTLRLEMQVEGTLMKTASDGSTSPDGEEIIRRCQELVFNGQTSHSTPTLSAVTTGDIAMVLSTAGLTDPTLLGEVAGVSFVGGFDTGLPAGAGAGGAGTYCNMCPHKNRPMTRAFTPSALLPKVR